jgi:hypothetical protein
MMDFGKEVAPGIVVIDKAINNPKDLIKKVGGMEDKWQSSSVSLGQGFGVNKEIRDADTLDISVSLDRDIEWFLLSKQIWSYADLYGKKYGAPFSSMEPVQMLRYEVDSGHYKPHVDSGPLTPRIFSAVLYLNDVEVGGETKFEKFNISIKPKAGRLVMFPANFIYVHSALPPKSNKKFAAVTWFVP